MTGPQTRKRPSKQRFVPASCTLGPYPAGDRLGWGYEADRWHAKRNKITERNKRINQRKRTRGWS